MTMHAIEPDAARPPAASAAKAWMRALERTARIDAAPSRTLPVVIDELAERFGEAPALLSDDENFSFRQLAERARRYARWAMRQGLQPGDAAALMMSNRPEYMAIWLGLGSVGVVTALLNTHLTGASLAHAVAVAESKAVIVDAGHAAALAEALERPASTPAIWLHGEAAGSYPRIDLAVESLSAAPLTEAERPAVSLSDRALLIYTSGTTGLPKAAHVSHHRIMMWSHWFAGLADRSEEHTSELQSPC